VSGDAKLQAEEKPEEVAAKLICGWLEEIASWEVKAATPATTPASPSAAIVGG